MTVATSLIKWMICLAMWYDEAALPAKITLRGGASSARPCRMAL